jgi:hypothetical protein
MNVMQIWYWHAKSKKQILRSICTPLVYIHAPLLITLGTDIMHKQMNVVVNNVLTFRVGTNLNAGLR